MSEIVASLLGETEKVLNEVVETKDFDKGFAYINALLETVGDVDKSIGIMLEGMEDIWKPEEHEGETFLEASARKTPLHPVTIRRHTKIQGLRSSGAIPEHLRPQFEDAGQKVLESIANVIEAGYEIEEDEWLALSEAVDNDKWVRRITQKIKKAEPRSNYLAITIDEKTGELWEHTKRGSRQCGILYVKDEDEDVKKAIKRLTSCSGVLTNVEY